MRPLRARSTPLLVLAGLWCLAAPAVALTPLSSLQFSPDITLTLGSLTITPQNEAQDNLAGSASLVSIGTTLPAGTRITGYQHLTNGDQLLSFDITVNLPGGLTAGPGDVVRYNGSAYSIEFARSAHGIPTGVIVDAVSAIGSELLLSFDTTVIVGGVTADNEDLVWFDGIGFSLFFDGSAAGVPPELNLIGAQYLGNGHLLLSFDGSGTVGGVSFNANDVLEYDPSGGTWQLAYNGSTEYATWGAATIDALAATPAGATAMMDLGHAVGLAGGVACVGGSLSGNGLAVAATDDHYRFDASAFAVQQCTISPAIGPGSAANKQLTRTVVGAGDEHIAIGGNSNLLPDGVRYVCRFTIGGGVAPGSYPINNVPTATAPTGVAVLAGGGAATVQVTTCNGDCDGNGNVTVGEVVKAVNMFLGQPFCNPTNPSLGCPVADINHDGVVSIGEVVQSVNRFLGGCK